MRRPVPERIQLRDDRRRGGEGRYGKRRTRTLNGEQTGDVFGQRDRRVTEEAWRGMPLLAPPSSAPSLFFLSLSPSVGMLGGGGVGWANFERQ